MRLLALLLTMSTLSAAPDLLRIPVKDIEGKETTLGAGKPRAVLVVNVASECGYTRQYAGLQDLHEAYKSKGLVVAGFPCNDFGGQEPGDEKEIRRFCSANFKVTFAMFSKVRIKGDAHPLYEALTSKACGQPGALPRALGRGFVLSTSRAKRPTSIRGDRKHDFRDTCL